MDLNINYYKVLGLSQKATESEIKKTYYKLSFKHHPDRGGDEKEFSEINNAYKILSDEQLRNEYDTKSRYGSSYDEYYELFNITTEIDYEKEKEKLKKFKEKELMDVLVEIDDTFDGSVVYERWVRCKSCNGSGKDLDNKIIIKDENGNILKIFEGEDGCDFCEGTGKDDYGNPCNFCTGQGKIGMSECQKCSGNGRILGKQRLTKVKLTGDETIIKVAGNFSGATSRVGDLILRKKL